RCSTADRLSTSTLTEDVKSADDHIFLPHMKNFFSAHFTSFQYPKPVVSTQCSIPLELFGSPECHLV
ncbi:hypothetical protein AB0Y31_10935, partial [Lactobacillus crispatus]